MNISIPKWIACKSYLTDTDESRTIISNNKNHQTILLDGISSDLYSFICASDFSVEYDKLKQYAISKQVDAELDSFLYQLQENELLVIDNKTINPDYIKLHYEDQIVNKEEKAIEDDMSKWCFEHNFLWSVFIEMTYKCNLKCIHCYNSKCDFVSQLKFEDAKNIIDDMVDLGCFNLILSGGECSLDSDFVEIVKYANEKHINVNIFTNGQTFHDNPKLFDSIVSLYPFRVGISIYSADEQTHDSVTKIPGSFRKSITVLEKLRQIGVNCEVKSVQLKETVKTWKETLKLAKHYDASSTFDVTLTPTIDGDVKTWEHSVSDDDLLNLYMDKESPLYMGNFEMPNDYNLNVDGPCFAGIHTLLITPKLDVTACVSLPLKFGNLKQTSLKQIWNDAVVNKNKDSILYKWQHTVLSDFKDCFKYDYCKFCHFCPGLGMLENKLFSKSTELCRIAKLKMKAFKIIKENT